MAVDFIVMHRSCSSLRVSVKRCSPALAAEMMPARWTRESVRVDFPWSTIKIHQQRGLRQRNVKVETHHGQ